MPQGSIIVLDVGKTLAKLTLWSPERQPVERRSRPNNHIVNEGIPCLDVDGIDAWLGETLAEFAPKGHISAIVPVAHGASGCIVDDNGLCVAPVDYEAEPPAEIAERYRGLRDPFALTGSPLLPAGLNLGVQLYWLDSVMPEKARRGRIVTWPQYWAWRLSGVASTEITSLGCHTDLWMPAKGCPSLLADSQGWAARFAPLRRAFDVLGPVTAEWRQRGLPKDCVVLCGVHDSNAALLAARLHPEIGGNEFSVLSTGTWFVAMRSPRAGTGIDLASLPEERDCLANVNAFGVPVPSSRFMGGREAELLEASPGVPLDPAGQTRQLLDMARRMAGEGVFALPSFEKGVGPFPKHAGRWIKRPEDRLARRAVAALYLALVADVSLDLIGSRLRLVIEGRFAGDPVFTRALASLRPRQAIYCSHAADSISFGALGLIDGKLPKHAELTPVEPLDFDIRDYARRWHTLVEGEGTPD
jgi:sugar (pentulose or hexulose) kinase